MVWELMFFHDVIRVFGFLNKLVKIVLSCFNSVSSHIHVSILVITKELQTVIWSNNDMIIRFLFSFFLVGNLTE